MNFQRYFKAAGADFLDMRLRKLPAGLFKFFYFLRCIAACNGGALPAVDELAFLLGSRVAVVERRLTALREAGLLEERDGALWPAIGGDDDDQDEEEEEPSRRPLSSAERTRRWRERRAGCDTVVTAERGEVVTSDRYIDPINSESLSLGDGSSPSQSAPDFAEFWSAFPKRDGDNPEQPARAAWRKAVAGGADPAAIVAGARSYAAATADRERKFIASAGRWLSEERWRASGLPKPAGGSAADLPGVWVEAGSPEWSQWAAWWRASKGKGPPVDSRGGWRFPSLVPPDARAAA
jgi:hypothetical protein